MTQTCSFASGSLSQFITTLLQCGIKTLEEIFKLAPMPIDFGFMSGNGDPMGYTLCQVGSYNQVLQGGG